MQLLNNYLPKMCDGMRVITDPTILDNRLKVVKKTWGERLWPKFWRYRVHSKLVKFQVPGERIYSILNETLVMHPAMLHNLRRATADKR